MNILDQAETATPSGEASADCQKCGFANPANTSFCGCCGTPQSIMCSACGMTNPLRFRFCGGCGTPLARENAPRPDVARRRDRAAWRQVERHQLTVMFCDLAGSTALSMRLDPEELREVLRSYQAVCAEAIERFGGYIAQYLGDGVLVYFGYPVALENEAERAVRAGLRVIQEMSRINGRWRGRTDTELAVRIGIHTGLVVVDEVGGGERRESLALGGTPNIAARLQSIAEPDTVVISGITQRLVSRHFQCEDLGPASLRGVTGIGSVYRVTGERQRPRAAAHRTSLVGRDSELSILADRWARVVDGEGQTVLVSGDAGIGKSHLIDEFVRRIGSTSHVLIECRCMAYYQNTAFHPIVDRLERDLGFQAGQEPELQRRALEAMLERDDLPVDELLPLFAALLELPPIDGDAGQAPVESLRERTLIAIQRLILKCADTGPVVFLVEDLHWADPSTLDLLGRLAAQLHRTRILALFTARPGFTPPWGPTRHSVRLDVGRLTHIDTERIVRGIAGKAMPLEVIHQIVVRTDGVPLFAEELSRTVLQSGLLTESADRFELAGPLPPLAIPTTLKDSLEARLDRLAPVKEVAQLAAMLGREFSYVMLRAIAQVDEGTLRAALQQLIEAELIYAEGEPPACTYTFKHALIQEAAYESLLRSTRQRHHARIARTLEIEFPEVAETEPETLAHHLTAADLADQAITHWLRAGRRAMQRSANLEAVSHLQRGIDLLVVVAATPERDRLEFDLQAAFGTALIATEGYTSSRVRDAYARAREICRHPDDTSRLAPVLTGLFAYYVVRRELAPAAELTEELRRLADHSGDTQITLLATVAQGVMELNVGRFQEARAWLERGIELYDPARHGSLAVSFGHDLGVVSHAYLGALLWNQGRPIQGLRVAEQGIELARQLRHPHSLALALAFNGAIECALRMNASASATAEELLSLATEWRFKHWQADALLLQACLLVEQGQFDAAWERVEEGRRLFADRGTGADPQFDIRLAKALGAIGRVDDAVRLLEADVAGPTGEGAARWNTDFYLMLGELNGLEAERHAAAETWLRRAIDHSAIHGTRWQALRAATFLARILQQRGEALAARDILVPIYESMEEGHELPDLLEAAEMIRLLDESVLDGAAVEVQ